MSKVQRCVLSLRFAFAFLAALVASTPLLAQSGSDCSVKSKDLSRDSSHKRRLAVRVEEEWKFIEPTDGIRTIGSVGLSEQLCMAWEAPPYEPLVRQIVYISTRYRDDQPISLFRNGAAGLPFLDKLLGDWVRKPDASGADPDQAFKEFHLEFNPNNLDPKDTRWEDPRWDNLKAWHDTSVWFTNRDSHETVSLEIDSSGRPYGTERLLRVSGKRPYASWIPFTTWPPSKQDKLRVAVSYSGDTESRVDKYILETR